MPDGLSWCTGPVACGVVPMADDDNVPTGSPAYGSGTGIAHHLADGALARLARADWLHDDATQRVLGLFPAAGAEARVVGGAVRNTLLDLPASDIDIATTAPPGTTMALADRAGLKAVPTGLDHGTVTVVAAPGKTFEVTTLRHDVETDGRHAVVAFTQDWLGDAARRDFTMNALYCDADGTLFDPLGGLADCLARRVRFIGDPDQRIAEDYLRSIRFFRFSAQYANAPLDADGLAAVTRGRAGLHSLAVERVRDEMLKLLAAPGADVAISSMWRAGVLVDVLGCVPRLSRLTALRAAMASGLSSTAQNPTEAASIDQPLGEHTAAWPARWPAERHALTKLLALVAFNADAVAGFAERWKLSKQTARDMLNAQAALGALPGSPVDHAAARRIAYRYGIAPTVMALHLQAADHLAATGTDPQFSAQDRARLTEQEADPRGWLTHAADTANALMAWVPPVFPLKGRDIIAYGVPAGPKISALMKQLEKAWIAADFTLDGEALLSRIREDACLAGSEKRKPPFD